MDNTDIRIEMDRVREDFHDLLDSATVRELRRPTDGTKWTNEQLLFHMVFGYLLVRNLLVLVRGFSRLPGEVAKERSGKAFRATRAKRLAATPESTRARTSVSRSPLPTARTDTHPPAPIHDSDC